MLPKEKDEAQEKDSRERESINASHIKTKIKRYQLQEKSPPPNHAINKDTNGKKKSKKGREPTLPRFSRKGKKLRYPSSGANRVGGIRVRKKGGRGHEKKIPFG